MQTGIRHGTPTTMHPMPRPKGGCHCSLQKNLSRIILSPKRGKLRGWFRASLPTSSMRPGCAMLFQSLPSTHPLLTSVTYRFVVCCILFFCFFFFWPLSEWQRFQSKQHPFKKSTAKMRWKWKKKRTRRLQRKRRKMRARAK